VVVVAAVVTASIELLPWNAQYPFSR